jgi:hypothetical protein
MPAYLSVLVPKQEDAVIWIDDRDPGRYSPLPHVLTFPPRLVVPAQA